MRESLWLLEINSLTARFIAQKIGDSPPSLAQSWGRPNIQWMDEILHHFETVANHCLFAFIWKSYSRVSYVAQDFVHPQYVSDSASELVNLDMHDEFLRNHSRHLVPSNESNAHQEPLSMQPHGRTHSRGFQKMGTLDKGEPLPGVSMTL